MMPIIFTSIWNTLTRCELILRIENLTQLYPTPHKRHQYIIPCLHHTDAMLAMDARCLSVSLHSTIPVSSFSSAAALESWALSTKLASKNSIFCCDNVVMTTFLCFVQTIETVGLRKKEKIPKLLATKALQISYDDKPMDRWLWEPYVLTIPNLFRIGYWEDENTQPPNCSTQDEGLWITNTRHGYDDSRKQAYILIRRRCGQCKWTDAIPSCVSCFIDSTWHTSAEIFKARIETHGCPAVTPWEHQCGEIVRLIECRSQPSPTLNDSRRDETVCANISTRSGMTTEPKHNDIVVLIPMPPSCSCCVWKPAW